MRKPPNETAEAVDADGRGGRREKAAPERSCILTRRTGARDELVRLALSPSGEVLPDVRARAPGRGAWIGVDRATLEEAQAKGKLRGALARAFKGAPLSIPDDLGQRIEDALRQAALDRLGLEARSGTLLSGSEKIETAARKGQVHLLLHAADASADGNRKLDQAWRVGSAAEDEEDWDEDGEETVRAAEEREAPAPERRQGLVIPAERTILSLALGRQNVVHVALIDRAAASRVRLAVSRWRAFIGPDSGLDAATAGTPDASAVDVNEGT